MPGQNIYRAPRNYTQWLNVAAFTNPPAATAIGQTNYAPLGGEGQQARGPGFNNLDSSIFKNFTFTETIRLQFRAEAFNTTNTPQFANPSNTNLTSSSFGQITATRFPSQASRRLQLALKLFVLAEPHSSSRGVTFGYPTLFYLRVVFAGMRSR